MRSSVLYHMIFKYHGVPEEFKSLIFHNRFRFMLVPFLLYGCSIFLAYLPLEWLPPNCAFTYIFSEPANHIHSPHDSQSHQPFQTTCSCYYFVYHLSFFNSIWSYWSLQELKLLSLFRQSCFNQLHWSPLAIFERVK